MARITQITAPDGSVTKIQSRSSFGCLTFFAAVVVIFGPAAWFPLPLAIAAYVGLAFLISGVAWAKAAQKKKQLPPMPPPV